MKTLDFFSQYVDLILQGKKTQTRRTRPYDFKVGDIVAVEGHETLKLYIEEVRGERLRSVTDEDGVREGFANKEEFLKCEWASEQLQKLGNPWVWVYGFKPFHMMEVE